MEYIFETEIGYILIDLSDETIEFKISIPVETYDEKTTENYRNRYAAEKRSF